MKKLLFVIALVLPVLASASMIDPLYDFDYARAGVKGLYLSGGPVINMDNAVYDKDGEKQEEGGYAYKSMDIWIPLKVGYSFNERYSAGIILPIASLSHTTTPGTDLDDVEESNFGLGNIWIWGKGCFMTGNGFMVGPRLGIKLPFGAYTFEDQMKDAIDDPDADTKAVTGDKSLAIDIAAVFAARPESNSFRMDGQLALRYSMEGKYSVDYPDPIGTMDYNITPGMTLNFKAMPGLAWGGRKDQESYLVLDYYTMLTEGKSNATVGGVTSDDTTTKGGSMLSVGIKHDWAPDPNNNVELKFLYDVMANGPEITTGDTTVSGAIPAGMSIGIGYFGYIPM